MGIVGAVIGAIGGWLAASKTTALQRKSQLDGVLQKTIELSIQYPTLEKESFCSTYPNMVGDQNGRERYENYCCLVFNFLSSVFVHFGGKEKEIPEYVHVIE